MVQFTDKEITSIRKDIMLFMNWKLNRSDEAEDLAQDTLLKVFTSLSTFDEAKGNFRNWYLTIANNVIKDYFRSNKDRMKEISVADFINENGSEKIQIADITGSSDNGIKRAEMHSELRKAIKTLNPEYRKIVILRFIQNMSCNEIADYCNMPLNSVLSMIARGRKVLQGKLQMQLV